MYKMSCNLNPNIDELFDIIDNCKKSKKLEMCIKELKNKVKDLDYEADRNYEDACEWSDLKVKMGLPFICADDFIGFFNDLKKKS